ncbi:MAG TPA: metallophosphoesterase [Thermoanaerobaculia bacterium]|nr:metallophosphoesterase [Thermoanaerobaculia bacterium]
MPEQAAASLRWLHLSDLHLKADETWDRRATLKALVEHARRQKAEGFAPQMVFLTGDVAFSGKREEYDHAFRFCEQLAKTLDLEPRRDFFVVPGNHDVDRSAIKRGDRAIAEGLESAAHVEEIFRDAPSLELLGRRLANFYAFTERLFGTARAWEAARPWRVDHREVGGAKVAILQLNSAWACGTKLEEKTHRDLVLLVGEYQLREALVDAAAGEVRIALVHHPIEDCLDFDRAAVRNLLEQEDGAHLLLRGHLHRTDTGQRSTPDGSLLELAAGCLYTGDPQYPRRYLAGELALPAAAGAVSYFGYTDQPGKSFWAPDKLTYANAPAGRWEFALSGAQPQAQPKAGKKKAARGRAAASLVERYREVAARVHGTVRFIGFGDHRLRPMVRVPELFVPLRMEVRGRQDEKKSWTTQQLLAVLAARGRSRSPRTVVLLGGPGSGKTTLCRFLTAALAGAVKLEGWKAPEATLPLFLPFREYVRECKQQEKTLLDFLREQARTHLQLDNLPEGFFEEAIEEGRAVLLLDGLDEVGSAAERGKAVDKVIAFLFQHRSLPTLLTSRIAGYDEAPVQGDISGGVAYLTLAPFSEEDLPLFVRNWYAIQEPEDAQARARGVEDLEGALTANPRVKELARNPMLATLIALVHRFEAHLPGERAKLYELCIKTLLETWPAAGGRRFEAIDEGRQRAYLEELAYLRQKGRKADDREVLIPRGELVETLTGIVHGRDASQEKRSVRSLVEKWVEYLEDGAGLLVEQKPGFFAFFHLSFLEYLAACGVELERDGPAVQLVAKQWSNPAWREACLLVVGRKATEKRFLDDLFGRMGRLKAEGRWFFLLQCLREEADFDQEQRERIVREAARSLLDRPVQTWGEVAGTFQDIQRFSLRHAKWARRWPEHEVARAIGEGLQGAVALVRGDTDAVRRALDRRPDAGLAAAALLDFWPGYMAGRWAVQRIERASAFNWASKGSPELATLRSLASLGQPALALAPGLLVALARRHRKMAGLAAGSLAALAEERRESGKGVPAAVTLHPSGIEVLSRPAWPDMTLLVHAEALARRFTRRFAGTFARAFARDFTRDFTRNLPQDLAWEFARDFARDFTRNLPQDLAWDFTQDFALDFTQNFTRKFALDFTRNFAWSFVRAFAGDFPGDFVRIFAESFSVGSPRDFAQRESSRPSPAPPSVGERSLDQRALDALSAAKTKEEAQRAAGVLSERLAAEAWLAQVTTVERPKRERTAYFHRRVQNAWLLQVWQAVDGSFKNPDDPDLLALYLALGWTQATTTWQWPATERWIQLLSGPPPANWLPRSQWHLCWLLHDNTNAQHRKALDDALAEGLASDQPYVAEALREIFPPQTG